MLSGKDPEIYTDVLLIPDRSEAHFIQLNVIKMSLPYVMAIILSVLRFTTSDYRMCNVKLFLWQYVLLVEGNQPTCHKAMTFLLHLVE
jgi:hypothetical protein